MRRMKKLQGALVGAALSGVCGGAFAQAPQPVDAGGRRASQFGTVDCCPRPIRGGELGHRGRRRVGRLRGDQPATRARPSARRSRSTASPAKAASAARSRRGSRCTRGRAAPSPTWSSPGTPRTRRHRDQARAIPSTADASFGPPVSLQSAGRGRRPRLARAGARRPGHGARAVARSSRPGGGKDGRAPAQRRARRRGDGPDARACATRRSGPAPRPIARSPPASATAASRPWSRWPAAGWCRRGVTSMPATCATSPSPSPAMAAPRLRSRPGSARTAGRSTAVPTTGRRWPPTATGGVAHRVADRDSRRRAARRALLRADAGVGRVRRPRPHSDAGQPEAVASPGRRGRHAAGCSSPGTSRSRGVRTAAFSVAERDGAVVRFGAPTRLASDGPTLYPVMAPLAQGVVVAWTEGPPAASTIRVKRLVAPAAATAPPTVMSPAGTAHDLMHAGAPGSGPQASWSASAAARRRPHGAPLRRSRAVREGVR